MTDPALRKWLEMQLHRFYDSLTDYEPDWLYWLEWTRANEN